MSISHQVARALAEQFYCWELRGRGWVVWPSPVQLEPPFRPFEGHFLPRRLTADDGQIESTGSRFAKGFGRLLGISTQPIAELSPEDIEEPHANEASGPDELVELQIALPPDYQPQANVFEQFLFSIGYARGPVAFEVIGTPEELVVQITVQPDDAGAVRRQLKAFFPEAIIVTGEQHLRGALVEESDGDVQVMDFGLEREFMVPINSLKALATDPLVAICGALDQLGPGEVGVFQVLLEPARHPWAASMVRAVSLGDGQPFFSNDAELLAQTRAKVSRPLYSTVVRMAARTASDHRTLELIRALAGALRPLGNHQGNRLVPLNEDGYEDGDHIAALVRRKTQRSGMLLNSDELVALAHLPTAAVRAKSLRRVLSKTKAAPDALTGDVEGVLLGRNGHEGISNEVRLPDQTRLNHCHILGGTGSGKSTLLGLMAWQDILAGRGVAVIDPHGDLIDLLIPHIPPERMQDVILFDPTDEEFAIAFNPLAAASDREKELLATDFIAVMKQHTASWGDQMSSLLGNAVLAFLCSSKGGTLPELRRFLADTKFRSEFLRSVTNSEVVYFWENEAHRANKNSIGSILTRLDGLLRYESLLHILGQRANRLDFADMMDTGKIFLARLSKGLIGAENAYLLGSLLVSRFYQTTIARQARSREQRRPFFLLMDEAGDLLTSTISEILTGTRKDGLGLTLAHQNLSQLGDVHSSVMGNCGTKVCFQVGGDDARKMAEEFAGFTATDLMGQPPLHAVARVGSRNHAFNLVTQFVPEADRPLDEAYAEVLGETRKRYCTPRATIRAALAELRRSMPRDPDADPFAQLAAKQKLERERRDREGDAQGEPATPTAPRNNPGSPKVGRPESKAPATAPTMPEEADTSAEARPTTASGKAESIKNAIIQAAGGWGYSYQTEQEVDGGKGRVDIMLTLGSLVIACEISATTSAEHEFERSIRKCLRAGFARIFLVCDHNARRGQIREMVDAGCSPEEKRRVDCMTTRELIAHLGVLAERQRAESTKAEKSSGKTVLQEAAGVTVDDRTKAVDDAWSKISKNMNRDRKPTDRD